MYVAILRSASGNPDLKFEVNTVPWKVDPRKQRDRSEEASGIFVCFVVGIAYSLIPASIASRLVHEKEKGLYHMQYVSGIHKVAYFSAFVVYDLVTSYVPCLLTHPLLIAFDLHYEKSIVTWLLYPVSVIPFTYLTSFMFDRETTA